MSVSEVIVLGTSCIGFVLGWISARIVDENRDVELLMSAVEVLQSLERNYV